MPNIFDVVLHHHQSLQAATPGKSGVHIGVDICHSEYVGVNHPHTQKLDPANIATNATAFFLTKRTTQRQFEARLSKRKVKRLSFDLDVLPIIITQEYFK